MALSDALALLETTETGELRVPDSLMEQLEIQFLRRCTKCTADCKTYAIKAQTSKELEKLDEKQEERVLEIIASLKERQKRTIIRKIKNGEIEFDPKREVLVYAADGKDFELGDDVGSDDDGEERKSDGDDQIDSDDSN